MVVPTGNVVFAGSGATRTMSVSTVDGRSGTAILTVKVTDGQASGSVGVTVQVGGGGKDTLTGGSGADLLLAQSNNDTLTGRDRNDLLCGDSGSDICPAALATTGRRQRQRQAHRRVRRGPLAAAAAPTRQWISPPLMATQ